MPHFLLTFDRQLLQADITEFEDARSQEAVQAFGARERELALDSRHEVVLLSATSLDDLRRTHANYFTGAELLADIKSRGDVRHAS